MRKLLSIYSFILLPALICMFFSCKKVYHSPNPTPANYRLLSYTKVYTPVLLMPIITESYRFVYDGNGRVSQEFFTSNDSNKVIAGLANLSIKFIYIGDSIYKISTDLNTSTVKERDTFIQNPQGQILSAYFPDVVYTYSYYGKLLANQAITYRDSGTTVSATVSYTSNNGDLLYRYFNGTLTATFPDSGIRAHIYPPDTLRDTILSLPLTVIWDQVTPVSGITTITHDPVNNYSDVLSGYAQYPVTVTATDPNGVTVRPGFFPAGFADKQLYQIYDYLDYRVGDYAQLEAFTIYGTSIIQQAHMFKSATSQYGSLKASYTIDADSKVSYMSVITRDSVTKGVTNTSYKLQYETF